MLEAFAVSELRMAVAMIVDSTVLKDKNAYLKLSNRLRKYRYSNLWKRIDIGKRFLKYNMDFHFVCLYFAFMKWVKHSILKM